MFYIIGTVVVVLGLANLLKALSRRSWPETIGRIHKNEQTEIPTLPNVYYNSGLVSKHTGRAIEDSGKTKRLWLSYVYVVDGEKIIGNQLYSAPIVSPKNRIFGLHEGDKVKVFYNPKNSKVAFLAHSFSWPSILVSLIGVSIIVAGFFIGLYE